CISTPSGSAKSTSAISSKTRDGSIQLQYYFTTTIMKLPFINQSTYPRRRTTWRLWDKILVLGCLAPLAALAQPAQETPQDSAVTVSYGFQHKDREAATINHVSGEQLRKTHTPILTNVFIGQLPGLTILHSGTA